MVFALLAPAQAQGGRGSLKPFKDPLFSVQEVVSNSDGGDDRVYSPDRQAEIFCALLKAGTLTRFTLYHTGSHGKPVRMTDWRRVLNWILMSNR